jgi:hypothetical protein
MEANFNWRGTLGGTLAMDQFGLIYLQRRWLLPLKEPKVLTDDLGRLVYLAETWRNKLEASSAVDAPVGALKI